MSDTDRKQHRPIRSFVRREGRITSAQKRALEQLFPALGVRLNDGCLSFPSLFKNTNPVVCEIGFGNGQSLVDMAEAEPVVNYFGIEVYRPGVGNLLGQVERRGLKNIRLSLDDAVQVFEQQIPATSLARVQMFFPDPWHKKRHNKRRLINLGFLDELARVIKADGLLHIATDWEPYAEEVLELLTAHTKFENTVATFALRPQWRPITKYEARGHGLGHRVRDILFSRIQT
ncbi:MAG: tRNA (guanosine(46)-N7)-methyltransferase TrmB [Proteobacteria bacterium]|jgi:tRNA (guanine-N7-)-methyltransferase|nr:tRNA (guanosine(46)-N7)-methyltransferase TrmB [Pseudomonadota bacterium]